MTKRKLNSIIPAMYITREIEETLNTYLAQFKCVLVTGARQAGKTTLLKNCLGANFAYVTLDDMNERNNAIESPSTFLQSSDTPIIIDEVQLVPQLFRHIKFIVDKNSEFGQVVLTGSQSFNLMQGISDSLAGRVGILNLSGLSLRELAGTSRCAAYAPKKLSRDKFIKAPENFDLWQHMCKGAMPQLQHKQVDSQAFYSSYVMTYIERDVRQLINLKNERKFYNFLVATAARTGQLLNVSEIASVIEIDNKTVQSWLSVLEASGIIHILKPLWANVNKRITKTPKLYFMDTGLACYLTGWQTAEQLKRGAMRGHMFETFVVSEVLKSFMNAGKDVRNVFFYRDRKKNEIDLVILDGRTLHPVEVKAGANIKPSAIKNFKQLESFKDFEVGFGNVICQTETPYWLSENVQAISVWDI